MTTKIALENSLQLIEKRISVGRGFPIVGPTGEGKSNLINGTAEDDVLDKLEHRIGNGMASQVTTNIHPTSADCLPNGHMLIKGVFSQEAMNTDSNRRFIIDVAFSAGESTYKQYKSGKCSNEKLQETYQKEVATIAKNRIDGDSNKSFGHKIKLLTNECKKETATKITDSIIEAIGCIEAVQMIDLLEVIHSQNKSSQKVRRYSKQAIADKLDSEWRNVSDLYLKCCNDLFLELKNHVIGILHQSNRYEETEDCIYILMNTETPESQVKMFLNSSDKSFEFLFDRLDVYFRIYDELEKVCGLNALRPTYGDLQFRIEDTMGLFHDEETIEEAVERVKDIIKASKSSVLVFMLSAQETANTQKALIVLKKIKESVSKDIHIIVMMPKVDEFLATNGNSAQGIRRHIKKMDTESLIKKVEERVKYIKDEYDKVEVTGRAPKLEDVIPYGIYSNGLSSEIISLIEDKYNMTSALKTFLKVFNDISEKDAEKISIDLDEHVVDIGFKWRNKKKVQDLIKIAICSKIQKGAMDEIKTNVITEKEKTGNGNSCAAAIRRAKYGMGYDGIIDEDWYKYCTSIYIKFPNNIPNILSNWIPSEEIIREIVIENGSFKNEADEEIFYRNLNEYFSKNSSNAGRDYSARMFYNRCIYPLVKQGFFSYSTLLKNSLQAFYKDIISPAIYQFQVDAFIEEYMDQVIEKCSLLKGECIRFY